ncbi:MAG: hypothetical protein J6Y37_12080 [Paludibacteraceae bacterium]|nr:hypothetical protein [Paludibacteraceae bacterium]
MAKDYVTIFTRDYDILGHKVREVYEQFDYKYLNSDRFQSRCLRCCFYNPETRGLFPKKKDFCDLIRCNGYSIERASHFELIE